MVLKSPKRHDSSADTSLAVDEFMGKLDHPSKDVVQAIRLAILSIDPAIAEGVKWNAPSYRTRDYFATTNLREKTGISMILHLGAKVRDTRPGELRVRDPEGLLKWLGNDRAIIGFKDINDFNAKKAAFLCIIQEWIAYV